MRSRVRFLLAAVLPALVAACGELPKPFAHEGPVTDNALLDLPAGEGVRVAAAPETRPELADPLTRGAAAALRDAGVPASTDPALVRGYRLTGAVAVAAPEDGGPETAEFVWRLAAPDGRIVATYDQRIGGDREGWLADDPAIVEVVARDAGGRVAAMMRRLRPGTVEGVTEAAVPAEPSIHVAGVTGAPGDGNAALTRALTYLIEQSDLALAPRREGAWRVVSGTVAAAPAGGDMTELSVTWRLTDAEGTEIATIGQANPVPARLVEGRWGDLAFAIAEAAHGSILDVIRGAPTAENRGLAVPVRR